MDHPRPTGVALALSRLGAHVARRFAERTAEIGLTPGDAALLRTLARHEPTSQARLASLLGLAPSRVVVVVDGLESRGLVERRAHATDRRRHDVALTDEGRAVLGRLRGVASAHDAEIVGDLAPAEVERLLALLSRLEGAAGIADDGHPGLR